MNTLSLMPAAECRALFSERLREARRLADADAPAMHIARACGWRSPRSVSRALWKSATRTRCTEPVVDMSTMQCIGMNHAFAGWAKTPKGDWLVVRSDRPGEFRRAKTSIEAWGVAESWLSEHRSADDAETSCPCERSHQASVTSPAGGVATATSSTGQSSGSPKPSGSVNGTFSA